MNNNYLIVLFFLIVVSPQKVFALGEESSNFLYFKMHQRSSTSSPGSSDKISAQYATAAGICLVSREGEEPHILLGFRNQGEGLCTLGGTSDPQDLNLARTASREVLEESMGIYGISPLELGKCFSHIAETAPNTHYKMYFLEVPFVSSERFNSYLEKARGSSREYQFFCWVPLRDLVEGRTSHKLYGPFQKMLQQSPVQKLLATLMRTKKIPTSLFTKEPFCTADIGSQTIAQKEKVALETSSPWEAVVAKSETNLLIQQYALISEARHGTSFSLNPHFIKRNQSPEELFLKNVREKSTSKVHSLYPEERSLSLKIATHILKDDWKNVGTVYALNNKALRENIENVLLKAKILPQEHVFNELLDTLEAHILREIENPDHFPIYHGAKRSIGDFFYTIARLKELLLISPTSLFSGIRASDSYFGADFPRSTTDLLSWLEEKPLHCSQYFCTSLGIWGCASGECLKLFSGNDSYGSRDLLEILRKNLLLLGITTDPKLLTAPFELSNPEHGELIQCLIPKNMDVAYVFDKENPDPKNRLSLSLRELEGVLRTGKIDFKIAPQVRLTPGSWNIHRPEIQFYGVQKPQYIKKRVRSLLKQTAVDWLESGKIFPQGGLAFYGNDDIAMSHSHDYSQENLPPLFKLAQLVSGKNLNGESLYKVSTSTNALPLLLESGDFEGALQYFKVVPGSGTEIKRLSKNMKERLLEDMEKNASEWKSKRYPNWEVAFDIAHKYLRELLSSQPKKPEANIKRSALSRFLCLRSYPEFQKTVEDAFSKCSSVSLKNVNCSDLPESFMSLFPQAVKLSLKHVDCPSSVLALSKSNLLTVSIWNSPAIKSIIPPETLELLETIDCPLPEIKGKKLFVVQHHCQGHPTQKKRVSSLGSSISSSPEPAS